MSDTIDKAELEKMIDKLLEDALEVEASVGEMPTAVEALESLWNEVSRHSDK